MKKVLASVVGIGLGVVALAGNTDAYTIQKDDTIGKISKQENVSIQTIKNLNPHILDINEIFVGEEIALTESEKSTIKITERTQLNPFITETAPPQIVQQQPIEQKSVSSEINSAQDRNEVAPQSKGTSSRNEVVPQNTESAQRSNEVVSQQNESTQSQNEVAPKPTPAPQQKSTSGGSVKDQFLAAGGTEAMWNVIVMPESSGNPNAVNELGYRGLGQTKESWGTGSVSEQTKGMINYAKQRYGSVDAAVSFRSSNNWW